MIKTPTPKPQDDPEQAKRFIETALKVEAEEGKDAFDEAFKKVVKVTPSAERPTSQKTK